MTILRPACLLSALLIAATSVSAAPLAIGNGAYAGTYVRDCRTAAARAAGSPTPNLCDEATSTFSNTLVDMRYDANYGGLSAAMSTIHPYATGTAGSVDAAGTPGSLLLNQATYSTTSFARASSQAEALQSFTWDGTGSSHRALSGRLDFSATNLADRAGFTAALTSPSNLVQASLEVFSLETGSFEIDTAFGGRPDFAAQASVRADFSSEAAQFYEEAPAAGLDWLLEFDMVMGRTYYMDAWFGLWAKFGASIDASHSMRATLGQLQADGSFVASLEGLHLAAASDDGIHEGNTVPEPSGSALLLLALGCVAVLRRQR
ncbi:MAG: PEP-CTERM sorting domain-containing protein [Pseudomonadota bacterium]